MNVLKKINDGLMAFIKIVLIFAGTLMTCLVIMNVILRYVFNSGLSWSEESCRFLLFWRTTPVSMVSICEWISSWKCSMVSLARSWR